MRQIVIDQEIFNRFPDFRRGLIIVSDVENGGVQDLRQLFALPATRIVPYSTPNAHIFICSSATPTGRRRARALRALRGRGGFKTAYPIASTRIRAGIPILLPQVVFG